MWFRQAPIRDVMQFRHAFCHMKFECTSQIIMCNNKYTKIKVSMDLKPFL